MANKGHYFKFSDFFNDTSFYINTDKRITAYKVFNTEKSSQALHLCSFFLSENFQDQRCVSRGAVGGDLF